MSNQIQDVLNDLRRTAGVKGAAVLTHDGLLAAAALEERFQSDVVVGLTSYLMMTTSRSLREGGLGACSQVVLHATHGKAIFATVDESYLVVLVDQFADLTTVRREFQEASMRIRRTTRLA